MSVKKSIPNVLTYLRIGVIPFLIFAFYGVGGTASYYACALLFIIASITDWLDGYLARIWEAQSSFGRVLDPIADKLLVSTALLLLVGRDTGLILPAIAIVCREILVSGLREFLAEIRIGMPVSRLAKIKTGVQMVAISMLLLGDGAPAWMSLAFIGKLMLWLAALLTLVTGYTYVRVGLKHMQKTPV